MTEHLALPGWKAPPRTLADWTAGFEAEGLATTVARESHEGSWIEVDAVGLRGYAVTQGLTVEAVNFEVEPNDAPRALALLGKVADALGWEVHEDDPDEDDDD